MNGLGRTSSNRGGLGRPARGGANKSSAQTSFLAHDESNDEEARAEHTSLLEELRNRVQKAESASEEYQKQLNLLQARLDESQQSHGQLEDQLHEKKDQVEELEVEKIQATRQKRDLEKIFEQERATMLKDREERQAEADTLQMTIGRLKASLSQKEQEIAAEREAAASRMHTELNSEGDQFAPSSSQKSTEPSDQMKTIEQKDRVIKSLRMELAEAQIKIMEIDTMGDGKTQDLEKALLEAKINNARLMEDNESFQLLLSEKTLNGEFGKGEIMQGTSGLGSLAEELGTEDIESAEGKSEEYRRLEAEIKSLKEQNKALALFIDNIIGRVLSHKDFENVLDKDPDLMSGKPNVSRVDTDKDLPPPPPEKDSIADSSATSFLQRAKSVMGGGPNKPRPRPTSQVPPIPVGNAPSQPAGPNEDPSTAPSIPLGRSQSVSARGGIHRRAQSELPSAAPIVNQMYRGPPSSGSVAPMLSPGLSPQLHPRTSFFSPAPASSSTAAAMSNLPRSDAAPRSASASHVSRHERNPGSGDSGSTLSDRSGGAVDSLPMNSAAGAAGTGAPANNYTGAVMTQNRLRPLRLVQENPDMEKKDDLAAIAARKKANRGSWMPTWMAQRATNGAESGA